MPAQTTPPVAGSWRDADCLVTARRSFLADHGPSRNLATGGRAEPPFWRMTNPDVPMTGGAQIRQFCLALPQLSACMSDVFAWRAGSSLDQPTRAAHTVMTTSHSRVRL